MTFVKEPRLVRHRYRRYDPGVPGIFLPGRFEYRTWLNAPGPCRVPYWRETLNGDLVLELRRGEVRMAYRMSRAELLGARDGWRNQVRRAVRLIRHALARHAAGAKP